jgi:NADH-quinone oxidoreductase subunit E
MERRLLLDVLHEIQAAKGYIGSDDLRQIADRFNLSMGRVFSEITWYDAFRTEKPGVFVLRICDGTVCHARGNGSLLTRIETLLGVKDGETTPDGRFTLHSVPCLGACERAPVMAAGERILGTESARAEQLLEILAMGAPPAFPDAGGMRVLDAGFPRAPMLPA